ncbi:phosphate ABC transporter permease PstA [Yinghuangia sp. ASG 101]|uniref:phosphate ABC transporter permease PstA n=1 Tax=Yinghuangia sp. ASG 101 TaxID=2896848 RepID=UPI001E5A279C|nr:phosphate ABC transporter permease PstA [Yinghuangia sp. ASG 101]UGQ14926.1 phosphate ABC transporter permease PstA [Yinghuangia sp. ASG 101]
MTITQTDTGTPADARPLLLTRRTMPTWIPWAVGAAAVALGVLVKAVQGNWALGAFYAGLFFVIVVTAVSWRLEDRRRAKDRFATSLVYSAFIVAIVPLVSILGYTIKEGSEKLSPYFLGHSMRNVGPRDDTGGIYHAMIGTLEQVGLAALMAVPIGLLTAIYLVEYGRGRLARAITFFVDVMTGIPSIVAGLFVYSFWILTLGFEASGFAGSLALMILMLPTVVRAAEEMLKLVPNELREASLALGVPKWRTVLKVVLPTAMGGIITGVMLAIARVIGETAPLLLLVGTAQSINSNPFEGWQSSIPLFVYEQNHAGNQFSPARAWAGALTLIIIVMVLNLAARLIAWWKAPKAGR